MRKDLFSALCSFIALFCGFSSIAQSHAVEFIANQQDTSTSELIYVSFTQSIYHTNSTIGSMPGFEALDEETKADLKSKYCLVLDYVSDSILLSTFKRAFISELQSYGFRVRECNSENFPTELKSNEHTINVAQLELEEFVTYDTLRSQGSQNPILFTKLLNGVRWNTWLRYNDSDSESKQIFFASEETTDEMFGYVEREKGKYYADYDLVKINPNDAYLLSYSAANLCGRYFFNFLINRYVWIKTQGNPQKYYYIDEEKNLSIDNEAVDNFDIVEED